MALNWLIAVAAVDIVGNGFQKGYIIVENGFFGAQKNVARGLDGWILSKNFLRQVGMFNFFAVCRFRNLKKVKKFFHKKPAGLGFIIRRIPCG